MSRLYKIAVVGPESTGKSTLSAQLACGLATRWVPEFARYYLHHLSRPYQPQDIELMASEQVASEARIAPFAQRFLICDTTPLVEKIWMEVKYGQASPRLLQLCAQSTYHYYLLTNIDLPWEEDPLREHPYEREMLLERYRTALEEMGAHYTIVSGQAEDRWQQALHQVLKWAKTQKHVGLTN
ncbi:MAG: ATP-binding protein [Cytophagales bacterium]|nr:ATP-binding protein [Cytophagales bacterium]